MRLVKRARFRSCATFMPLCDACVRRLITCTVRPCCRALKQTGRWSISTLSAHLPAAALPEQFCNLQRLLFSMRERGLDGIVATTGLNTFYLSGLNGIAHKSDEPRPYAVILSRHCPEQAVLVARPGLSMLSCTAGRKRSQALPQTPPRRYVMRCVQA